MQTGQRNRRIVVDHLRAVNRTKLTIHRILHLIGAGGTSAPSQIYRRGRDIRYGLEYRARAGSLLTDDDIVRIGGITILALTHNDDMEVTADRNGQFVGVPIAGCLGRNIVGRVCHREVAVDERHLYGFSHRAIGACIDMQTFIL